MLNSCGSPTLHAFSFYFFSMPLDLLRADPVLARLGAARRRRRRRRWYAPDDDGTEARRELEPPYFSSWDDVFASGEPCMAATRLSNATQLPALERWRDLDVLRHYFPSVTVHDAPQPVVQMSSMVQPMGTLTELAWHRPWHERNVHGPACHRTSPAQRSRHCETSHR